MTRRRPLPPPPCANVDLDLCEGTGHALWFTFRGARLCRTCMSKALTYKRAAAINGGLILPEWVAALLADSSATKDQSS